MELGEALEEDRRARESDAAFMLGRFVCPASRLAELPDVGRGVSAVLDAPLDGAPVEAVETTAIGELESLPALAREVYVEVPLDDALEERLDALASQGLAAKVRCGGASVPATPALAGFVRACGERGLPFKATAGLHHAVRTGGGEHGFLNLLAAVVFGEEEDALGETDSDAFVLDAVGFRWGDRQAGHAELAHARHERLHSIGSCSFFEPVDELRGMGVLPL